VVFSIFLKEIYAPWQGYQDFFLKKNWIRSHNVNSHKLENNPLSFDNSHKSIIIDLWEGFNLLPNFDLLPKVLLHRENQLVIEYLST
jgi:hypothetical protein